MRAALAGIWPLLLGMGLLMFGGGLQSTLLGLRATLEGFPPVVTGFIMASYYLGFLGGTSAGPHFVQRVGHIRVFAAFTAIASVTILVQSLFVNPWIWGAMRLVSGLCFAGIYVVAESWLNDRASSANRGRLIGIYMLVLYTGLGVSQFLLVAADPRGHSLFMLVSILITLAMLPMALSAQRAPELRVPEKVRCRDLYRHTPLGVVAVAISGMIGATLFSIGPVYARLRGLDTLGVAAFMGASILASVLTQYPVGRLSDRWDRRTVIAWVCTLATAVAGTIVFFDHLPYALFLALVAIFGGLVLTIYSLGVSHTNDHLKPSQMVAASSSLILVNGTGAAVGPILVGALMQSFGERAYFATLAGLTGTLMVYDLWRKIRSRPVPAAQKGHFIGAHPEAVAGQVIASAVQNRGRDDIH